MLYARRDESLWPDGPTSYAPLEPVRIVNPEPWIIHPQSPYLVQVEFPDGALRFLHKSRLV